MQSRNDDRHEDEYRGMDADDARDVRQSFPLRSAKVLNASVAENASAKDKSQSGRTLNLNVADSIEANDTFSSSGSVEQDPARDPDHIGDSVRDQAGARAFAVRQEPPVAETVAVKDALNRARLSQVLMNVLTTRTDSQPLSLALFGPWGAGKSSLFRFLQVQLSTSAKPRFRFAEFNAWKSERVDNIAAALAQAVVEALTSELSFFQQFKLSMKLARRRNARLRKAVAADVRDAWGITKLWVATYLLPFAWPITVLACVVILFATSDWFTGKLAALSSAATLLWAWITAQLTVSKELLNWFRSLAKDKTLSLKFLPDFGEQLGSFHEMSRTLDDLCALSLGTGNPAAEFEYLLLVVDDLDRCTPAAMKQVFDAVRLVANIPRVVVMVALDHRIAYAAVAKHYFEYGFTDREVGQVARDYLAKVFNLSVVLPPADADTMSRYIRLKLFDQADDDNVHVSQTGEYGVGTAAGGENVSSSSPFEAKTFVELANRFAMNNPRELWRLRQTWSLLKGIALSAEATDREIRQLMTHLFVREVVSQGTAEQRITAEQAFGKLAEPSVSVSLWTQTLTDAVQDVWQDFAQRDAIVRAVLLPAAPTELQQTHPGAKAA